MQREEKRELEKERLGGEERGRSMVGGMRRGAMEFEDRLATLPRVRGDLDDDGKERRTGTHKSIDRSLATELKINKNGMHAWIPACSLASCCSLLTTAKYGG